MVTQAGLSLAAQPQQAQGVPVKVSATTRAAVVLTLGVICSIVAVIASSSSTGADSFGGPATVDDVLADGITTVITGLGFGLLAVASRWMSLAGLVSTLAVMAAATLWVSAEMWNSSHPFDGLAILLLMVALPPLSAVGVSLDIGGRALARRVRYAKQRKAQEHSLTESGPDGGGRLDGSP
jgi:hypothetical protein